MIERTAFAAARLADLAVVLAFVDAAAERAALPDDAAFALRLAVEEAFTNVVRHGYGGGGGPVRLTLEVADGRAVATLEDEAPLFDPEQAPRPELDAGLDDRAEGGLGWHLIRQLMDEVQHRPAAAGTGNIVTLVKRLPAGAA